MHEEQNPPKMQIPILTILLIILGISLGHSAVIKIQDGYVRGYTKAFPKGTVSVFYGIPFAKPPTDELRFKKPQLPTPWNGTLDATKKPNSCPQVSPMFSDSQFRSMFDVTTITSEDCLYLNVWTPETVVKDFTLPGLRDVIFWIHGGGFELGGSMLNVYEGAYIASMQNVVFVSINYRLGPLGFLYLGNEEVPGNMALYDMIMALDWVNKNIGAFGGNPNSVTIIGESAGGSSVSSLLLSPHGKGKFKNAVVQSGTLAASWSYKSKEEALKIAKDISAKSGCSNKTGSPHWETEEVLTAVIKCLRKLDTKTLYSSFKQDASSSTFDIRMAPTIDGHFFPESPTEMMKKNINSANIMIGHTAKEVSIFVFANDFLQNLNFNSSETGSFIINTFTPQLTKTALDLLQIAYTDWTETDNVTRNRDTLINLMGDISIVCPNIEFASAASSFNKVYYYEFQHTANLSNLIPKWLGAFHGLDVPFFLGTVFNKSLGFNDEDRELSNIMMKHLVNFARSGNPTESANRPWLEFKAKEPHVFVFGKPLTRTAASRVPGCIYLHENFPHWLLSPERKRKGHGKEQCSNAVPHNYDMKIMLIGFLFPIIVINNL